ncbi:hypothetical protein Ancab_002021 [Ancistrocladus abbreviatus]
MGKLYASTSNNATRMVLVMMRSIYAFLMGKLAYPFARGKILMCFGLGVVEASPAGKWGSNSVQFETLCVVDEKRIFLPCLFPYIFVSCSHCLCMLLLYSITCVLGI